MGREEKRKDEEGREKEGRGTYEKTQPSKSSKDP